MNFYFYYLIEDGTKDGFVNDGVRRLVKYC